MSRGKKPQEEFIPLKEASKRFGMAESTLRVWMTQDRLRGEKRLQDGTYKWFVRADDLVQQAARYGKSIDSLGCSQETRTETSTSLNLELDRTRIKTLEELLIACEVNLDVWECERFIANKWEVGAKGAKGELQVEPLFQVKAFFRRRSPLVVETREIIDRLKKDAARELRQLRPAKRVATHRADKDLMAEVAILDPHFGKLGWLPETGQASFDLREAVKRYDGAAAHAIQKIQELRAGTLLLPIGNDQIHFDSETKTTTAGTLQDADGRLPKVFVESFHAIRRLIDAAIKVGVQHVEVPLIRGNHAEQAEFALAFALWCWYRDDPRVEVDHSPAYRKTFEWGDCLLAFTHGKEASRKKLPTLIMSEFREQVGKRFIEIHTGDLHQVRLEEEFGIRVRILPSLAGTDAWHARKGYVMNLPQAETYFWHKKDGLRAIFPYTV